MIIHTGIVEDEQIHASRLREYILSLNREDRTFEVSVFNSAESFLAVFRQNLFQLLFLDIQLPKMDGLSAARRVRETDMDAVIVFITSSPQFAIHGYEVNAKDYILKPLIYDAFTRKMERIVTFLHNPAEKLIPIGPGGGNDQLVSVDNLLFVEVFGHKLVYHCKDGDLESYGKISDAEVLLKTYKFIRCNRNAVINPRFIRRIQKDTIFIGKYEVLISAPRRKACLEALNEWIAR